MVAGQTIGIAGAGSIGCFVGGMLAAGGRRVALLARPRVIAEIEAGGLRPTSFEGFDQTIPRDRFALSENPHLFEDAGIVLVTVKSADTAAMADIIARHAPSDVVIVSLQNGVGNAAVLRARLPGRRVLGGMVPFNVIALGNGRFHRATSGDIVIEQDEAATAEKLSVTGPDDAADRQHRGRAMGQARAQSQQRAQCAGLICRCGGQLSPAAMAAHYSPIRWRKVLAAIRAEGIKPVSPTPIPPALDAAAAAPAQFHLRTDAGADHEDRSRGALVDVGRSQETAGAPRSIICRASSPRSPSVRGLEAPLSRRIVELIRQAEHEAKGSPGLTPEQVPRGELIGSASAAWPRVAPSSTDRTCVRGRSE
jgi:2-dehydropantoate 2-reductase